MKALGSLQLLLDSRECMFVALPFWCRSSVSDLLVLVLI